jgi:hypothetical protein
LPPVDVGVILSADDAQLLENAVVNAVQKKRLDGDRDGAVPRAFSPAKNAVRFREALPEFRCKCRRGCQCNIFS